MKLLLKLALVSALSIHSFANAAIINLGTLTPLHLENFNVDFSGGISDEYTFTTTVPFAFTSSVIAGGPDVTSLTTILENAPFSTVGTTTPVIVGGFQSTIVESFLAAGDYSFTATVGASSPAAGNGYFGNFTLANVTATSPVPEPATYAMFLAGLGLLGFASRRKA